MFLSITMKDKELEVSATGFSTIQDMFFLYCSQKPNQLIFAIYFWEKYLQFPHFFYFNKVKVPANVTQV